MNKLKEGIRLFFFFGVSLMTLIFWNRFLKQKESYSLQHLDFTYIKVTILNLSMDC